MYIYVIICKIILKLLPRVTVGVIMNMATHILKNLHVLKFKK